MKTKEQEIFKGRTALPASELVEKLRQITAEDFDAAKNSREFQYYGKINGNQFDLCNAKYSLYSSGPSIQGEIEDSQDKGALLKFNIDIDEHKKYVNTIITLAIFVVGIAVSLFTVAGQEDLFTLLSVAAVMVIFPLLYGMVVKLILRSYRKDELKRFLAITESKLA